MDIQQYIASGIIERYVMGKSSLTEKEEFEKLSSQYPQLIEARKQFELSLQEEALSNSTKPPAIVKEKLMAAIRNEKSTCAARIVKLEGMPPAIQKVSTLYWTIAASIILIGGLTGIIWFFYQRNEAIQAEINLINYDRDSLDRRTELLEDKLNSIPSLHKMAEFKLTQQKGSATIRVYWDSTTSDVYLLANNLAPLPAGKQYHLWSVANSNHKSLGLFDAPADDNLILKMNNAQQSDSFAITIENTHLSDSLH